MRNKEELASLVREENVAVTGSALSRPTYHGQHTRARKVVGHGVGPGHVGKRLVVLQVVNGDVLLRAQLGVVWHFNLLARLQGLLASHGLIRDGHTALTGRGGGLGRVGHD